MPRYRALVLLTVAALAACTSHASGVRNTQGEVVEPGVWSVFDLRRGDCLAPPADAVGEAATIAVVPCASTHTQEVFATVKHTADAFPGIATLQRYADAQCTAQLGSSLGLATTDGWFVSYLLPSFDSWNKRSDKTVTCVLVFPNEPNRTGSVVKARATASTTTVAPKG